MPLSVVQRQTVHADAALRLFDPDVPNRALLFSVLEGKMSARVVRRSCGAVRLPPSDQFLRVLLLRG
jgi:hypothetical protein